MGAKIDLTLGLIPTGFEAGLNSAENKVKKFQRNVDKGMRSIVSGGMMVAGSALSIASMVGPAQDVHSALGEVASLGVSGGALGNLQRTSEKIAAQYNLSSSDINSMPI